MTKRLCFCLSASALAGLSAFALVALPGRAGAEPPPDNAAIVTLQDENASITTSSLPDRYYVNGLRLGYVSPTDMVPDWLGVVGAAIGGGRQRYAIDIEQEIFTPANTTAKPPPSTDRPYAGLLTATFSLIADTDTSRTMLGAQLGLVGPGAGAEEVQNAFHDVIGQSNTQGWNYYQVHNEPVGELLGSRVWRFPVTSTGGIDADVLPAVTVGLGNERVYGLAGGTLRFGQGLTSDYGVARVAPGLSGGDAFTPVRPFDWYVFLGADGQIVPHDITLDGNTAETSPSVSTKLFVAEFQGGVAVILHGVRVTYTQVLQTEEFKTQHAGLHQFGSLTASIRF